MTYYTIVTLDNGKWSPQWGTFDKKEAQEERATMFTDYRRADVKIIATDDNQAAINAGVAALNTQYKANI